MPGSARLLCNRAVQGRVHQNTGAQKLEELAPIHIEVVQGLRRELITFGVQNNRSLGFFVHRLASLATGDPAITFAAR